MNDEVKDADVEVEVEASETPDVEPDNSDNVSQDENNEPDNIEEKTPEWFMSEKYTSIDEQAKALFHMQSKMGKNWGAPEGEYSIDGDAFSGIKKDDPLLKHITPTLKELGLSQDGFKTLVTNYQDAAQKMAEGIEHEASEYLKNNPSMAQDVKEVEKWIGNSFSEEDASRIKSWALSIDDFALLNKIRVRVPASPNPPNSSGHQGTHFETVKQVQSLKTDYKSQVYRGERRKDKDYENELSRRYKDAYLRENRN